MKIALVTFFLILLYISKADLPVHCVKH